MRLILLGRLALEPSTFTRPKPLLLLAYLSLGGPRSRREVAELFWQGSKDPMQGLRMALLQLKDVPEAIKSDEKKVWTELSSDLAALQTHLSQGNLTEALRFYKGSFLEGFDLSDIGEELEEWIFKMRERVAEDVREAVLNLAETDATKADYKSAASRAEEAYLLRFAPEPDGEMLRRIYTLLRSNENVQAESVAKEARGYGLELALSPQAAREQLSTANSLASGSAIPKRRATDLVTFADTQPATTQLTTTQLTTTQPTTTQPSGNPPPALVPDSIVTKVNQVVPVTMPVYHVAEPQRTLLEKARPRLTKLLSLVALAVGLGFTLAFFALRPAESRFPARHPADDVDVSLDNGDNYFCYQHPNLYLSSQYQGQSTALRFRDVGIPKGKKVTIQNALLLFTASAHISSVPEGAGFVVKGLFDSSPWLVNEVCEQIHSPAGDNYASRVRTQASVNYQPDTWNITQQYSVDVTSIVQEIVASPDWTGDGVAFAIDNLSNSSADLKAYSNEGGILQEDLSRQPQFVVTFTTK